MKKVCNFLIDAGLNTVVLMSLILINAIGIHAQGKNSSRGPHVGNGQTGKVFMNLFDSNKDGKISHDEWENMKKNTVYKNKRWPDFDRNRDGWITIDETPESGVNWEPAPAEEKKKTANTNQIAFIVKYDKNGDGKVDKKEFTGEHFAVYDKNSDGFIEPHEAPEGQTAN